MKNKTYIKPEVEVSNVETILPIATSVTMTFGEGNTDTMDAPTFNEGWWVE